MAPPASALFNPTAPGELVCPFGGELVQQTPDLVVPSVTHSITDPRSPLQQELHHPLPTRVGGEHQGGLAGTLRGLQWRSAVQQGRVRVPAAVTPPVHEHVEALALPAVAHERPAAFRHMHARELGLLGARRLGQTLGDADRPEESAVVGECGQIDQQ